MAEGTPSSLGGREAGDAVVSWRTPEGVQTKRTAEPTRVVSELAAQYGGEIPELTVRRPSLEDVYLSLVGRPAGNASDEGSVGEL